MYVELGHSAKYQIQTDQNFKKFAHSQSHYQSLPHPDHKLQYIACAMIPGIEAQAKDGLASARNRNPNDEMWIGAGLHSSRVRWSTADAARFRHCLDHHHHH